MTAAVFRDLKPLREFWQTTAPYDPVRTLDSRATRCEQGKAQREQAPRESHVARVLVVERAVPVATLFPELELYLRDTFELAAEGTEHVVTRY